MGGGLACLSHGNHFGFDLPVLDLRIAPIRLSISTPIPPEDSMAGAGSPGAPVALQGPVGVMIYGRTSPTATGSFDTEMLSLDLSGALPGGGLLMIRESPTLTSTGHTSITPIGGGLFKIDSFFDVFTELSLDGGNQWIPAQGSVRVVLGPNVIPEPGTWFLLGTSLASCATTSACAVAAEKSGRGA